MSQTGRRTSRRISRKKYRISVEGSMVDATASFHQIQSYLEDIEDLLYMGLKVTIELVPAKAKAPRYIPKPK